MRPPEDGLAPDLLLGELGDRVVATGRVELAAAMRASSVVVGLVPGHDRPQMSFAEDQHPIGQLRPRGEHEPFRVGVRTRASGRDLHRLDTGAGQDGAERCGELPGLVTDQEPEVRGPITEVHQKATDLLSCPRPVRVRGDPQDVEVTAAYLQGEQAIQALERYCAVHVEEVGGEHRRYLGAQELPPGRVGVPRRHGGICRALRTRRIVDAPTLWPSLSSSPWIRWYPQPLFSVASRSISAAISAPAGGRPLRFGQVHFRAARLRCRRRPVPE
jgi:hypothetical protein